MGLDKQLAISALTMHDKKLAEIRTRIASMKDVSIADFNDLDRLIISNSLRFTSMAKMLALDFGATSILTGEANKWWDNG